MVRTGVVMFALIALSAPDLRAQKVTSRQRQEIRKVETLVDQAERQFNAERFEDAAKTIAEAQAALFDALAEPTRELVALAQPQYERIKKAHELLAGKINLRDAGLEKLPPLPQAMDADEPQAVAFSRDVAPILVGKCGRCHVSRAQGRFSASNYQMLMEGPPAGPVIVAGQPDSSRLIEVIESGDMPRAGGPVTDEELATLKKWIADGAKFDGPDPTVGLARLAPAAQPAQPDTPEVKMATGSESVSFSLRIAPVIVERCAGCHFEPRNARGGLNMTTFAGLLRGGDNGAIVDPGHGSDSTLVLRLRGMEGVQAMPLGGPRLPDDLIADIEKWIDEGAAFDGRDANENIRSVAAVAKAASASHDQLSADRATASLAQWKLAAPDTEPQTAQSDDMLFIGDVDPPLMRAFCDAAQSIAAQVKEELKLESAQPLVKGRMSVFLFARRYDYAEFGRMVEQRDLPKAWQSHWRYDTVSARSAFLLADVDSQSLQSVEPWMAQRLAATTVASWSSDIPRWFADGIGFQVASRLFARRDEVRTWSQTAAAEASQVAQPNDLLTGRLPEDRAAWVGWLLVDRWRENRPAFDNLLRRLRSGESFDPAFAAAFGATPAELFPQTPTANRKRGKRATKK